MAHLTIYEVSCGSSMVRFAELRGAKYEEKSYAARQIGWGNAACGLQVQPHRMQTQRGSLVAE
jgi:hypothetical protein